MRSSCENRTGRFQYHHGMSRASSHDHARAVSAHETDVEAIDELFVLVLVFFEILQLFLGLTSSSLACVFTSHSLHRNLRGRDGKGDWSQMPSDGRDESHMTDQRTLFVLTESMSSSRTSRFFSSSSSSRCSIESRSVLLEPVFFLYLIVPALWYA
jgi:hypothetical protein